MTLSGEIIVFDFSQFTQLNFKQAEMKPLFYDS